MSVLRKKKLLFAIDSLHGGGAERMLCQLASELDPARYEVQIALTLGLQQDYTPAGHVDLALLPQRIPADLVSELNPQLVDYENLATRWFTRLERLDETDEPARQALERDVSAFRTMVGMFGRHVRAWSPDCIMSFLPNSNMIALLARLWYRLPVPLICSDRNHLSHELPRLPWSGLRRRFICRHYPTADAHIAVSPGVADDLHTAFGIPRDRIRIILNGVDHVRIRQLSKQADATLTPPHDKGGPHLLGIGRLNRQKGFDLLLKALAKIHQQRWQLTLLGDGEEEGTLRDLAQQLGISDRVKFAGWQANPYAWMARSDIMVSSSRWEGMPNALLEAMALGLPIVATDCPSGPRLLLDDGRAGRLVDNDSVEALSAAVAELLALRPEERSQLGALAARRSEDFGLPRTVAAYRSLLDAAIAREIPLGDTVQAH